MNTTRTSFCHSATCLFLACLVFVAAPPAILAFDAPSSGERNAALLSQSVEAAPTDVEGRIRLIDREIILQLVDLDRFNIRYRLQVNRVPGWRKALYPMLQEGNAGALMGFSTVELHQSNRGWNNPRLVSKTALRKGVESATVGALLGGVSSTIELMADANQTVRDRRAGFSQRQAVSFEKKTINHVNELLAQRDQLMNESNIQGTRRELVELKGQLCKYIRDRLIYEFEQWDIHAREYSWYKNTFYVLNCMTNYSRFGAAVLALRAFNYPRYSGGVGPILITSASIASVAPGLSSLVGRWQGKQQRKRLRKEFGDTVHVPNEEMNQHYQRLQELLSAVAELDDRSKKLLGDLALLRKDTIGVDETIHREATRIRDLRRVATQNAVAGPLIGALGIASGTINTVSYYKYRENPKMGVRLLAPTGILSISAESVALAVTPASAIHGFMYEHKLRSEGQHPEQLLAKRLTDLDELESSIKGLGQP